MYDLLLPPAVKGLNGILEIFKENLKHPDSGVLGKSCSDFFWKFLQDHLQQGTY